MDGKWSSFVISFVVNITSGQKSALKKNADLLLFFLITKIINLVQQLQTFDIILEIVTALSKLNLPEVPSLFIASGILFCVMSVPWTCFTTVALV